MFQIIRAPKKPIAKRGMDKIGDFSTSGSGTTIVSDWTPRVNSTVANNSLVADELSVGPRMLRASIEHSRSGTYQSHYLYIYQNNTEIASAIHTTTRKISKFDIPIVLALNDTITVRTSRVAGGGNFYVYSGSYVFWEGIS